MGDPGFCFVHQVAVEIVEQDDISVAVPSSSVPPASEDNMNL
jgi:hypothetical protein